MQEKANQSLQRFFKEHIVSRWYLIVPAISVFIYIALRAFKLSLTWDEANTFFEYVRTPNWLPHDYNYMSANNHLLNTWLMKCSVNLFGESEFALRLPNVLSAGIFFIASIRLLEKLFQKRVLLVAAFLILTLNPFVLDFFSIARGYGISIAMMMCGLAQVTKYIFEKQKIRYGIYAQLFFVAATLANLTLIHVLIAVSILLMINRLLFYKEIRAGKAIILFTIVPVFVLIAFIPYINQLKNAGALFYGQEAKLLSDTFFSISRSSIYDANYSSVLVPIMTILISAIPLITIIHLMRNAAMVLKNQQGRWIIFMTFILFFTIVGPLLQHFIFKTNLLSGRTALFYLPLIVLNFLGLLYLTTTSVQKTVLLTVAVLSIVHFSFTANLNSFYDWKEQADVKEMMQVLKKQKKLQNQQCFAQIISTDLPYEKQINYYRMRFDMKEFGHVGRNESVPLCSYYYLPFAPKDTASFNDFFEGFSFPTQTRLFRSIDQPGAHLNFITEVWQDFENEDPYLELRTDTIYFGNKGTFAGGDHPYSISVPISIPDSVNGNIVASVNCRLYYYTRNTSALLVFGFDDGKAETWEAMHITELPEKPGEWSITGWTRPVPPGTKKIRIYLWNRDETEVLMDNVALRLLSYPQ